MNIFNFLKRKFESAEAKIARFYKDCNADSHLRSIYTRSLDEVLSVEIDGEYKNISILEIPSECSFESQKFWRIGFDVESPIVEYWCDPKSHKVYECYADGKDSCEDMENTNYSLAEFLKL